MIHGHVDPALERVCSQDVCHVRKKLIMLQMHG